MTDIDDIEDDIKRHDDKIDDVILRKLMRADVRARVAKELRQRFADEQDLDWRCLSLLADMVWPNTAPKGKGGHPVVRFTTKALWQGGKLLTLKGDELKKFVDEQKLKPDTIKRRKTDLYELLEGEKGEKGFGQDRRAIKQFMALLERLNDPAALEQDAAKLRKAAQRRLKEKGQ